jgi:DNA-binding NarL/FixJ family response regulator
LHESKGRINVNKRILLIEDDALHRGWIRERIEARWPNVGFEFPFVANERQFIREFDRLASAGLDLIIIDQMIPYTSEDDESDNSEALTLSAFRGGSRCYERLRGDARTQSAPVVFFTLFDRDTVPPGAAYVKKTGDIELSELLEEVEKAIFSR